MQEIKIEDIQERETYLIEYVEEMETSYLEAMPKPLRRATLKDYQFVTIVKIELPFYIVTAYNCLGNTVTRFGEGVKFFVPSKDFLAKFKKEKRCRNCC
jgi:hypothetical protein